MYRGTLLGQSATQHVAACISNVWDEGNQASLIKPMHFVTGELPLSLVYCKGVSDDGHGMIMLEVWLRCMGKSCVEHLYLCWLCCDVLEPVHTPGCSAMPGAWAER